ncbi:MAG: hypothetical protein IPN36_06845 [Bacteroidetes bacterium]|nr:hypothetical protein [Bacteroidota bacterium]
MPLYLDKKSETLRSFEKQLRDGIIGLGSRIAATSTRQGINKNRLSKSKALVLQQVRLLLKHFRSVKRIREAKLDELT